MHSTDTYSVFSTSIKKFTEYLVGQFNELSRGITFTALNFKSLALIQGLFSGGRVTGQLTEEQKFSINEIQEINNMKLELFIPLPDNKILDWSKLRQIKMTF